MSNFRILTAANFAAQRHSQQRRKGVLQEPYVNHLIEVAEILAGVGAEEILLTAALLHDCVEDAGVSRDELQQHFGSEVAELVLEVSDDKSLPKARRKELQVEKASSKSEGAKMLKIADKISNLRALLTSPPQDWEEQRIIEYFHWAKRVVDGCRGVNPRLDALFDETFSRLQDLEKV